MGNTLSVRANVILVLVQIHQGQSLAALLDDFLACVGDNEKGFAHELLLGVLRQWYALSRIGESLAKKSPNDTAIVCALYMGLYELLYMRTPDYATINETIVATKQIHKAYGAGFINAILRKVSDNIALYTKKVQKNHSLPNWLAKQLKQDWGVHYAQLGQNLRVAAPIFLRPNARFCSVVEYALLLQQQKIDYEIVSLGMAQGTCIRLISPIPIRKLPKFDAGWVSVQDRHAQLSLPIIAQYIQKKPIRILDACAAPGGKTAQLLEYIHHNQYTHTVTALDIDEKRLALVHENLQRLQLQDKRTKIVRGDARTFVADAPYDVVVLDAPCSAVGVLRRHPDIALLRTPEDVADIVQLQADILANIWQHVAVHGYLLYITCSMLKQENEQQILRFLDNTSNASEAVFTLDLPNQIKQKIGYQCLPLTPNDGDGFYYAVLQKVAE